MNARILLSGFGGQGLLFGGKFISYIGLINNREVSWLPSYGPEMRGGTARCSVILSDTPIGSPIVDEPDMLIAMNLPSLDRFADAVVPGGHVFVDSSLVDKRITRDDVTVHYIPATRLAEENGLQGLGNIILCGAVLKVLGGVSQELIEAAMQKTVPERKQALYQANLRAIAMGMAAVK